MAAGTYKPGLQLLIWRPNDPHLGQSAFVPFASVAVTTLMRQSLRGGLAAPEKPPGSPRKALPDQAIPESVQILPLQSKHDDIQVLLGTCTCQASSTDCVCMHHRSLLGSLVLSQRFKLFIATCNVSCFTKHDLCGMHCFAFACVISNLL